MVAVDTNVLVYSHRRESAEHAMAKGLVQNLAEGPVPWAIPWPCIYEFFSVVTHPRIWKEAATSPVQAWSQISAWLDSPTVRLIAETDDFPAILSDFARRSRVRGPVIHDARVAAICVAHGAERLLSRDRDFSLFPELQVENPFE